MADRRRPRRARSWRLAAVASLAAHVVMFAILILPLRPPPTEPGAPSLSAVLTLPMLRREPPPPIAKRRTRPATQPGRAPAPTANPSLPASPVAPSFQAQPGPALSPDVSSAFRGSALACANSTLYKLTPEERAACARRAWTGGRTPPVYAVVPTDPEKAAELERAVSNEAAWENYRDTIGGAYPGLQCAFGRNCTRRSAGSDAPPQ
jgi:hypothetical protein